MLDEGLPTFFIRPSGDGDLQSTIFLGQGGNDLKAEYTVKKPDPKLPAAKNCYAIALYDSYNPEVLYAEVLVQPEWTQPTLSQAEARAQNGIPPPPVPIVPTSFTIQLYNPDQQVVLRQVEGSWNTSSHFDFEMPKQTFRQPSASALDRSQDDPAASDTTPKVTFKWKRDGKLSKDIACYLAGLSTTGRKSREPDILIATYRHGKQVTMYEPNMARIDVEDSKGLEVVILLGAMVIKDIFFNPSREMFNITGTPPATTRKNSGPRLGSKANASPPTTPDQSSSTQDQSRIPASQIPPPKPARPSTGSNSESRPIAADPRTQWEIDAETARLRAAVEAEEHERERQERAERKRIKKMLEGEEKERQRREAEVAKETERLRRQYGVEPIRESPPRVHFTPPIPPRPLPETNGHPRPHERLSHYDSAPHARPTPTPRPHSSGQSTSKPDGPFNCPTMNSWWNGPGTNSSGSGGRPPAQGNSPYLQPPGQYGSASSSGFFSSNDSGSRRKMQKKRSVYF